MNLSRLTNLSRMVILTALPLAVLSLCSVGALADSVKIRDFGKKKAARNDALDLTSISSVSIEGESLVPFLEKYAETYNFEFILDRRVDPERKIAGSFSNVPFLVALKRILEDVDLYCYQITDSLLYIGSGETVGETLLGVRLKREESANWSKKICERLNANVDLTIPQATETGELFKALEKKTRVKLVGAEHVPFDRVRGIDVKDAPVGELLTIITFGYNLDFKYDMKTAETKLIALDRKRQVARDYPQSLDVMALQKDFTDCAFEPGDVVDVGSVRVSGSFEDVARMEFELWRLDEKRKDKRVTKSNANVSDSTKSRKASGTSRVEISGSIRNKTLRDIFAYLKQNAQIECVLDSSLDDSDVSLDTRVSCEFKQADAGAVATTIARKLGVDCKIEDGTILFWKE